MRGAQGAQQEKLYQQGQEDREASRGALAKLYPEGDPMGVLQGAAPEVVQNMVAMQNAKAATTNAVTQQDRLAVDTTKNDREYFGKFVKGMGGLAKTVRQIPDPAKRLQHLQAVLETSGDMMPEMSQTIQKVIADGVVSDQELDDAESLYGGLSEMMAEDEFFAAMRGRDGGFVMTSKNSPTAHPVMINGAQLYGLSAEEEMQYAIQQASGVAGASTAATNIANQRSDIENKIYTAAAQSARQRPKIESILKGIQLVGTGKIQEATAELGAWIPGGDPTDAQALNAEVKTLVFEALANFPGAISEGEREFARQTVANMGNTTKANEIILKHMLDTIDQATDERNQYDKFEGPAEQFRFRPNAIAPPVNPMKKFKSPDGRALVPDKTSKQPRWLYEDTGEIYQ